LHKRHAQCWRALSAGNSTCARTGLINQHLSLLSFVTIGVACGADELLVTAASSRDLFRRDANWFDVDFNKLWNATALAAFLQGEPAPPPW